MRMKTEIYLNRIYPANWNTLNVRDKEKKEREYNTISFLLKSSSVKPMFAEVNSLVVEFYEEPDFIVHSHDLTFRKIGIEHTKCYVQERNNTPKINSDLEKICIEIIDEINEKAPLISSNLNYINVVFAHDIMVGT